MHRVLPDSILTNGLILLQWIAFKLHLYDISYDIISYSYTHESQIEYKTKTKMKEKKNH